MAGTMNRRVVLASRPHGDPAEENFRMEETPIPTPEQGQVLLRTLFLSLDPYMRGRMNAGKSYAPPVEIGHVMGGATISEVLESKAAGFAPGDVVASQSGWQEYGVADAKGLRKVDAEIAPISTALGILGMTGMTAWSGMRNIGQPKPGETVVVAAAAGAVGSAVGQIAKIQGCRAVGVAGGPEKCRRVVSELGFDACIDHRSPHFAHELRAACPDGIDVYFENVGGAVLEAVLPLLNDFARVPVCGLISQYCATELPSGPDRSSLLMGAVLVKRLTLRGFIVSDFFSQFGEFTREMSGWVREGRIRYHEDIVDGLENAVHAFQGLLKGKNFGKLLIRVAPAKS